MQHLFVVKISTSLPSHTSISLSSPAKVLASIKSPANFVCLPNANKPTCQGNALFFLQAPCFPIGRLPPSQITATSSPSHSQEREQEKESEDGSAHPSNIWNSRDHTVIISVTNRHCSFLACTPHGSRDAALSFSAYPACCHWRTVVGVVDCTKETETEEG